MQEIPRTYVPQHVKEQEQILVDYLKTPSDIVDSLRTCLYFSH